MSNVDPIWLRETFWVKIGMFFLAALLWFLVVTEKAYEDTFAIPIIVTGVPEGMTPATDIPGEAVVRFHGRAKELIRIRYVSLPHINLDLGILADHHAIKLKSESVVIPGGMSVSVVEILKPDSIVTELDEFVEVEHSVQPVIDLKYAPGYTLFGEPEIRPATVKVSGPKSIVSQISEIHTKLSSMVDLSRTTEFDIKLDFPHREGVRVTPEEVKIMLHVERIGEREIGGVTLKVVNLPENRFAYLEPQIVKVSVNGAVTMVADLIPDDIQAWVDCQEFDTENPGWLPVHVKADSDIALKNVTPAKVRVTIRK